MDPTTGDRSEVDPYSDLPSDIDQATVRRMRTVARILDDSVRVPGTDFRIGLDPILGVLPGAGDAVSAGFSLYIVVESARLGVSPPTLIRMLANVSIDVAGGSVPIVGGVFDAAWKANRRNVELAVAELASPSDPTGGEPTQIDIE